MAEVRKIGDLTVNDGKGLLDNEGLCESLIADLNELIRNMAAGQYIRMSIVTAQMYQKLNNLQQGIVNDRNSLKEQLEEMRKLNNELAEKAFGMPVVNGGGDTDGSAEDSGKE